VALAPGIHLEPVDWPRERTPGFHRVSDFAGWLVERYFPARIDFLIGHSMGGLVAIEYLAETAYSGIRLILVESFLTPPGPFFQNLVMAEFYPERQRSLKEMLQRERGYYSAGLQNWLKTCDDCEDISRLLRLGIRIRCIYGDRGCRDRQQTARELAWPQPLNEQVPVDWVRDACHFPMLENPVEMAAILRQILEP